MLFRSQYESDGETKEVPNVALVNESPYTFFGHLVAFSDLEPIEDVVFAIKRTGKNTDTSYTLMRAGDAVEGLVDDPEIQEFFESFDFEDYLEGLADEDRVHELLDLLPDDAVVSRYAKKDKDKAKGKKADEESETKPASTRSRRAKVEEPVEEEPEEEQTKPAARSRRFSNLKTEMVE